MKKKISLILLLVLIAGAIWYLEAIKSHSTSTGASQAINADATVGGASSIASSTTAPATAAAIAALAAQDKAAGYQPAIEIADPTGFINTGNAGNASDTFTLKSLIGKKVILLDFWTYSCINCIRTLPYLTAWYSRYASSGLEIVGIQTPEFEFEKDINNVRAAVAKYGIKYPVVLDSNMGTWNAYGNLYWPHEYLIDMAGYIVHDQIGEGNYGETETKIQELLAARATILGTAAAPMPTATVSVSSSIIAGGAISPETYFGSNRNEYLGNGTQGVAGTQSFAAPASTALNTLYLTGSWDIEPEFAQTPASTGASPGAIYYRYNAKGVYFVAGSASGKPIDVEVFRDGKPIDKAVAGADIFYKNGMSYVEITGNRLYRIIDDTAAGSHLLEFIIPSAGLQAYTFTFG
jgi:thiol-disulfide isomerase/thioredoxin